MAHIENAQNMGYSSVPQPGSIKPIKAVSLMDVTNAKNDKNIEK